MGGHMSDYSLYWGDSHTNIHAEHLGTLDQSLAFARELIDFWPLAYYPMCLFERNGFPFEDWMPEEMVGPQWRSICEFAAEHNQPGQLVIFPGYEWQGKGEDGDHNVFFNADEGPLFRVDTLTGLYELLRACPSDAIAIPHHTAYLPGVRSKNWDVHDEALSPFAEIYSEHGCSESDEEWIGLRRNRNMGPGVSGGTIEDGLERGYRLGIVCSNDSHDGFGAHYGRGIMACYARELTRDGIWEAFKARRVYGVTGDRIELLFTAEDAWMGEEITKGGPVRLCTTARCSDALDRIELIRNNRVIATHCHNGTWQPPTDADPVRCKLRVEAGWHTTPAYEKERPPVEWDGSIEVDGGTIRSVEKCWKLPGQAVTSAGDSRCEFAFRTVQEHRGAHTEANVFEIEAPPSATVRLRLNGAQVDMTVAESMHASRMVTFIDQGSAFVRDKYGIDPDALPRRDRLYYYGPKAKVHRAIPESGFAATWEYIDETPPEGVNHYRVRVTERNGQVAWSSPIWVTSE